MNRTHIRQIALTLHMLLAAQSAIGQSFNVLFLAILLRIDGSPAPGHGSRGRLMTPPLAARKLSASNFDPSLRMVEKEDGLS